MKTFLKFDLPEEREEFEMYLCAPKYYSVLIEMREQIRKWRKYEDRQSIAVEELSDFYYELLKDNEITNI